MKDRYVANKLGLVNFWYYDLEEFQLSEGKLLLRGSNGSGKSVTMQSFIPLLLDGNKAPERLDPFGTKSRTITNYLLDEETEEKTGYLYIEFKRKESESYISIGMGIKALKNKSPQSWYFIITDGRRINKDLFLYRDAGELIPLTKRQLQNELGDVNFFTESQRAYMEKVNEYLFGFDDIEAYEELLSLLISIRSPKLSKDFKPTEIYKILTDSLKVLSDDDLRPISDSLENMDGLKNSLEENEAAIKAAKGIKYYYDKYNSYILWEKAKRYTEKLTEIKDKDKEIKLLAGSLKEKSSKRDELVSLTERLRDELKRAEETYDKLVTREELRFKSDLLELKRSFEDGEKDKIRKEASLQEKKTNVNIIEGNLRTLRSEIELQQKKLSEAIYNIENLSEEVSFEAGKGLEMEDLFILEPLLKEFEGKLKEGRDLITEMERQKERLQEVQKECDTLELTFQKEKNNMRTIEELFSTEKENYKVSLNNSSKQNKELTLEEEERLELFKEVERVENPFSLNEVSKKLNEFYTSREHDIKGNIHLDERVIEDYQGQIALIEKEIKELIEGKEIEPERSPGVIKNRERLKKENIPFTPLYKAIIFDKKVDDRTRNAVESALWDMGLLDALVIEEKYRAIALDFPEGMEDKYIFSRPNIMSYNLTSLLKVDKELKEKELIGHIDEVLQSIFLEEGGEVFLNEKGEYSIGILRGKSSDKYVHKYIGESSRKRHRELIIEEKRNDIRELEKYIGKLRESIAYNEGRLKLLTAEYNRLPSLGGIEEAVKLIVTQNEKLKGLEDSINGYKNKLFVMNQKFMEIKNSTYARVKDIELPITVKAYEEALEVVSDIKDQLRNGMVSVGSIKGKEEALRGLSGQLDILTRDLDELYYEVNILLQKLRDNKIKQESIEAALAKTNIKEIEEEIESCLNVKRKNPEEISRADGTLGSLKAELEALTIKNQELDNMMTQLKEELIILEDIFMEEYKLAYILPKEEGMAKELCKKVLDTLGEQKSTSREALSNELISSFNRNSAELREYSIQTVTLFRDENREAEYRALRERTDLRCRVSGKEVGFLSLIEEINAKIEEQKLLISDEERRIFEEVLMNTVSVKIRSKIYQSKEWIDKINGIMEEMDTTSTLKLSITWTPNKAEEEGQLNVSEVIDIMSRGGRCTEEELKKMANHFTLKVKEALRSYEGSGELRNYHTIIKEVLDYRKWYQFKLYYTKRNERKRELTNNEFFRFSGGEKAMSMYIPLFSALYARYKKARVECPRIISMDEAFAGVDEDNIRDMFKLLKKLDMDYILNSQILWGTYDTVDNLSICELIREDNDNVVTVIRYHWNGKEKRLVE
ncbi:MAG: TIGR02680 family protein [Clostridiaceae bacterium]